ncbi:Multidrug resistance-associated protein 1 [Acropora cervicornis]|uniref:Multidrug resistance-associated protein 1 n=1 Tax=Acropora cervicornis TaxID=6130 RepID=A0AAD9QSV4_ACRCE|nr:Multidrug resistance-associated protein 1 [Acropora cervicornis]
MDPDSDQGNSKKREPCPEDTANCLSRISFWWLNWILWTGYKRPLEEEDLWALNSKSRSSNVVPRLRSIWNHQKRKCKRSHSFIFLLK